MDESGSRPRIFRIIKKMIISAFARGSQRQETYILFYFLFLICLRGKSGVFSLNKVLKKTFFKTIFPESPSVLRKPMDSQQATSHQIGTLTFLKSSLLRLVCTSHLLALLKQLFLHCRAVSNVWQDSLAVCKKQFLELRYQLQLGPKKLNVFFLHLISNGDPSFVIAKKLIIKLLVCSGFGLVIRRKLT